MGAILFVGAFVLGAGTLRDIALALFVGMLIGTFSSVFLATPFEVALREREPAIQAHTKKVLAHARAGSCGRRRGRRRSRPADARVPVGALKPGAHQGDAAQPKRSQR